MSKFESWNILHNCLTDVYIDEAVEPFQYTHISSAEAEPENSRHVSISLAKSGTNMFVYISWIKQYPVKLPVTLVNYVVY